MLHTETNSCTKYEQDPWNLQLKSYVCYAIRNSSILQQNTTKKFYNQEENCIHIVI